VVAPARIPGTSRGAPRMQVFSLNRWPWAPIYVRAGAQSGRRCHCVIISMLRVGVCGPVGRSPGGWRNANASEVLWRVRDPGSTDPWRATRFAVLAFLLGSWAPIYVRAGAQGVGQALSLRHCISPLHTGVCGPWDVVPGGWRKRFCPAGLAGQTASVP
jgi:hypothetical protein